VLRSPQHKDQQQPKIPNFADFRISNFKIELSRYPFYALDAYECAGCRGKEPGPIVTADGLAERFESYVQIEFLGCHSSGATSGTALRREVIVVIPTSNTYSRRADSESGNSRSWNPRSGTGVPRILDYAADCNGGELLVNSWRRLAVRSPANRGRCLWAAVGQQLRLVSSAAGSS